MLQQNPNWIRIVSFHSWDFCEFVYLCICVFALAPLTFPLSMCEVQITSSYSTLYYLYTAPGFFLLSHNSRWCSYCITNFYTFFRQIYLKLWSLYAPYLCMVKNCVRWKHKWFELVLFVCRIAVFAGPAQLPQLCLLAKNTSFCFFALFVCSQKLFKLHLVVLFSMYFQCVWNSSTSFALQMILFPLKITKKKNTKKTWKIKYLSRVRRSGIAFVQQIIPCMI